MALTTAVDDVAVGVIRLRHLFVNVSFIGTPDSWVLSTLRCRARRTTSSRRLKHGLVPERNPPRSS